VRNSVASESVAGAEGAGETIIQVVDLVKQYRGGVRAVDGVSFEVRPGEIFGFLGPNGAGKTTTIMCLITLLEPTSGRAVVCGYDAARQPDRVRSRIGYVSQDIAVDDALTGRENLYLQGRLYHLDRATIAERSREVLEMVDLTDRADDIVATYSGGMRKRLDIAEGLIHRPAVLFLDEPTLGLDIQTRRRIWDYVRLLRDREGITVFMTTHYMEEADQLCDRIAIIDHGRIAAIGPPGDLKAGILDGGLHGAHRSFAFRRGGGEMKSIPGHAVSDNLAVDSCATRFGALQFFQDDNSRALSHNKSVAIPIKGSRGPLGFIVAGG